MTAHCLRCHYRRDGLAADIACPECGEPAPPREWIVLHGTATGADPRWSIAAVVALLAAGTVCIWIGARSRNFGPLVQGIAMLGFAGFLTLRRWKQASRDDGSDCCWIVKPDEIEVRGLFHTANLPFRTLQWAHFERGWRRHVVCLSVTPHQAVDLTSVAAIWIDDRDYPARSLHDLLRGRIQKAKLAPEPPLLQSAPPVHPPITPPRA